METESAPHCDQNPNQSLFQKQPLLKQPLFRMLVVEDNITNQKVILRQLQSLGYEADLAGHGQAALDLMAQTWYAVVLMDCRLPGIDGYRAAQLIRQREHQSRQYPRTIIIALTASDEPEAQAAAAAAGMDDFLTKPLRRETLAAALERWHSYFLEQQLQEQLQEQRLDRESGQPEFRPDQQTMPPAASEQISSLRFEAALHDLQFDTERLHQFSDHNLEFERELLRLYRDDTQAHLQRLRQAIDHQNLSQIEQLAHHIKGSSTSVGASPLEQLAETLEQQAKQAQPQAMMELISQLSQRFEQMQLHLNSLLQ